MDGHSAQSQGNNQKEWMEKMMGWNKMIRDKLEQMLEKLEKIRKEKKK